MTTYQTKDIDQAAYLATVCGPLLDTLRDTFDRQPVFAFVAASFTKYGA